MYKYKMIYDCAVYITVFGKPDYTNRQQSLLFSTI